MNKFESLKARTLKEWEKFNDISQPRILVGTATCGRAAGALNTIATIKKELKRQKITALITEVGCIGLCYLEPMVDIMMPGKPRVSYGNVTSEIVPKLIKETLGRKKIFESLCLGHFGKGRFDSIPRFFDHAMLKPQIRIVLKNCGLIDPSNLNHYIANGGYEGLVRALKMTPEDVVAEVRKSGLRGRGGAGFPTYKKWEICRRQVSDEKYLICNSDEGDPGAFMNRSLIESDPHAVLEGMLIAAYAIGATAGYIYIRAEYPLAIERLKIALNQMHKNGLLGKDIMGSKFSFDIKIKEGAGAFVCGEETALIASVEGRRGMPRSRPPYPAEEGLWSKPTIINNVESLGTLPAILRNGGEWYAKYGTENSKGTKTFALAGKMVRTGLIEVPMGITIKNIVYDIGGGILKNKKFRAIQTGGPSGGCLPDNLLTLPIDYESLTEAGSIMGSGGMIVMDEETCVVDIARYFLDFTQKESCGKCVPCRVGTRHILEVLEKITTGKGEPADITKLEVLCETVKYSSLCGLGQTAPNPVITTLKYFKNEYEAHIDDKKCPALVCKNLIYYYIEPLQCTGCMACIKFCPSLAISGKRKEVHVIDQEKCIKCGICLDVCPEKFGAVVKKTGKTT